MASIARRLPRFALYTFLSVPATLAGVHIWTRQCYERQLDLATDPIIRHPALAKINPTSRPGFQDSFARQVAIADLDPALVQDAQQGGSKLIEKFAAGVWGGYAYSPQRTILKLARKSPSNGQDLWEKPDIQASKFQNGTILADDFTVLDKTPRSIVFRGGLSPRVNPDGPREFDTIVALTVDVDEKSQKAAFQLTSMTFNGIPDGKIETMDAIPGYLHQLYAKLLITNGVSHCTK